MRGRREAPRGAALAVALALAAAGPAAAQGGANAGATGAAGTTAGTGATGSGGAAGGGPLPAESSSGIATSTTTAPPPARPIAHGCTGATGAFGASGASGATGVLVCAGPGVLPPMPGGSASSRGLLPLTGFGLLVLAALGAGLIAGGLEARRRSAPGA